MDWQDMVSPSFGSQDVIFAGHPSDEAQAKKAIAAAKAAGATKDDFEKEMVWHVYKTVLSPATQGDLFIDILRKQKARLDKLWK